MHPIKSKGLSLGLGFQFFEYLGFGFAPRKKKRIMLSRNYVSQIIKWHLDTIYVSKKFTCQEKFLNFQKKKKFFYMFFTYLFFFFYKNFFLKNFIFNCFFFITCNIAFFTCKQLVKKNFNCFNFRLIFKKNNQVLIINMLFMCFPELYVKYTFTKNKV